MSKGTSARATWQVRIFVGPSTTLDDFTRTFAAISAVKEAELKRQKEEYLASLEQQERETVSNLLRRSKTKSNALS